MTTLSANTKNRVRKLPKPSNYSQAMQPLFEAVSNAMGAIEDRFTDKAAPNSGSIEIDVAALGKPDKITISVLDNGIGLDAERFQAFSEVDTEYKSNKGGKGVGRLFWLDAYETVKIDSRFGGESNQTRSLDFILRDDDQLSDRSPDIALRQIKTIGTIVRFSGLRSDAYRKHFPKRRDVFLRYFSSHFIADFLIGSGPEVIVDIDGEKTTYPKSISELVVGKPKVFTTDNDDSFGILELKGFFCDPKASAGLDGKHQLHLIADGRSVGAWKIDKLIGVESIEGTGRSDLVFHGCVSGEYLNQHVNEGRTAFNLTEETIKQLCRHCADVAKQQFLKDQIQVYEESRLQGYRRFVERYPIYGFDDEQTQIDRLPYGATKPEEFASALVKFQIRREEDRQNQLSNVIQLLDKNETLTDALANQVEKATKELRESELLSLAQHVVRRKLVLELMERLLGRIRENKDEPSKDDDFHLESTLHSLIVPMRLKGTDPNKIEASSHDLWIVDERLAFTRFFASDERLNDVLKQGGSSQRPDLLVWNIAHGLGVVDIGQGDDELDTSKPLSKVLVVEFKRPGRRGYPKVEDQIEGQIIKYLKQLKNGEIETYSQRRVRVSNDCLFQCYVVADIEGELKDQLLAWKDTANGCGKIRALDGEFKGSTIEIVQWQDLVNEAWARNQSTINAAGLRRTKM